MARNRTKRATLLTQVQENLTSKLAIGQSKKNDKQQYLKDKRGNLIRDTEGNKIIISPNATVEKIYAWNTYKTYLKHNNYFVQWCRQEYHCKTLKDCRVYADEYLQKLIDEGKSASTIKMTVSALGKLYGCSAGDFIQTPTRARKNIVRSRGTAVRDRHFSKKNNAELINFCQCTGLRRAELSQLRGTDLVIKGGEPYLHIHRATKGGRERYSPIAGTTEQIQAVVSRMKAVGKNKVWEKVSGNADIHSYRSDYCNRVYRAYARELKGISDRHEIYYCKKDLAGTWYDKKAMAIASKALGHNRIGVIASNYLRAT